MGRMCSRTRTRDLRARTHKPSIPCDSPRASCGEATPTRLMRCTWIYGTTILIQLEKLAILHSLPRDREGPVFAEPWQAQAFALTVQLSHAGCFSWCEW